MANSNLVSFCSVVDLEEIVEEPKILMQCGIKSKARVNFGEQALTDSEVVPSFRPALKTFHGPPPPFLAKHIASTITDKELARLRVRYSIPDMVSLRRLKGRRGPTLLALVRLICLLGPLRGVFVYLFLS